ncbi:probable inactive purple acid phosphatase 27 [Mercurialis annua]|uniref:probable inactive purple acid phosphatase 27 n=1 Tax=Mercurialis annua TaxID=3986 RepID=UPI00215DE5AC|nr:probable inactive purple acid phosphatase 27 [Mercurialis annua]
MKPSCCSWVFFVLVIRLFLFPNSSFSYSLHPAIVNSTIAHANYTGISSFRVLNRRSLLECPFLNIHKIKISVTSTANINNAYTLSDEEFVNVTVSGVSRPTRDHWIAMISPSDASSCPLNKVHYVETGDITSLPLLCHYPVKAKYMSDDPEYLKCKTKCSMKGINCFVDGVCSGTLNFHLINIRSDIEFVLFAGGFDAPCILARSGPFKFSNPNAPLHGHLSSTDSTGTSMRVTWTSGSAEPQEVEYNGKAAASQVTTFTQRDMCSTAIPSPARDFGWHDPGFIHSAIMTRLTPSTTFSYRYGSDLVGWSVPTEFKTPPAGGADEVKFLAFGDMGKAPRDAAVEHFIQPGSISVIDAIAEELKYGNADSIFHIGDISYATGFLVEWDYFLHQINPVASRVSYMTAMGNHERDYIQSGGVYGTPDSGGECGVPYEKYFPMPTYAKDKPWYSIEQGSVHFVVMSTENDWSPSSEQYQWMRMDMASVNRSRTPWLIFTGHRPMYSSDMLSVDGKFVVFVEPLLVEFKVDLVLVGHVHNYERSCSVSKSKCLAMPTKDANGTDTYDHSNYVAPVHTVIGMAGFRLDNFPPSVPVWSLKRISSFGYSRVHATKDDLKLEFVNSYTRQVMDSFRIIKKQRR